ncbi:MAG: vitamin K epoxide reductase family protein [Pyrinomonadaceae bacterium]|jgi:uncharacterized membrane protein
MIGNKENGSGQPSVGAAFFAAVIALIGIADALYLTVHHYTAEPVPCSVTGGCETVLTSSYSEFFGIPIAAFGAAAYFAAFSLAVLTAFGNSRAWMFFKLLTFLMAAFSLWLVYLQAFVIGAFCQFCLISAGTSVLLFISWLFPIIFFRKGVSKSAG